MGLDQHDIYYFGRSILVPRTIHRTQTESFYKQLIRGKAVLCGIDVSNMSPIVLIGAKINKESIEKHVKSDRITGKNSGLAKLNCVSGQRTDYLIPMVEYWRKDALEKTKRFLLYVLRKQWSTEDTDFYTTRDR